MPDTVNCCCSIASTAFMNTHELDPSHLEDCFNIAVNVSANIGLACVLWNHVVLSLHPFDSYWGEKFYDFCVSYIQVHTIPACVFMFYSDTFLCLQRCGVAIPSEEHSNWHARRETCVQRAHWVAQQFARLEKADAQYPGYRTADLLDEGNVNTASPSSSIAGAISNVPSANVNTARSSPLRIAAPSLPRGKKRRAPDDDLEDNVSTSLSQATRHGYRQGVCRK